MIYLVSVGFNADQIKSHCWGAKCGKGCIGAVILDGGEFMACKERICPIKDKELDIGKLPEPDTSLLIRHIVRKLKKGAVT